MSSTREKGATPPSTTPSASPKRFPGASRILSRGRVVLDDFLAGAVPTISYHTGTIGLDHHRRHIPIGIASNGRCILFRFASDSCKAPEASKSDTELLLK